MKDEKLHVIHILNIFFEDNSSIDAMKGYGGAQRFVFELAKEMSNKVNTKLIIFGKEKKSFKYHNLDIEMYPAVNYFKLLNGNGNPISFKFLCAINDSDIVHIHQLRSDLSLISAIYSRLKGKRVFVTDHGWNGACMGRLKIVEHLVNGFLPDTKFDGKFLQRYGKHVRPIYGGVDIQKFCPSETSKRSKRILFVGRIVPHKGINYLIEAIDKNIELRIVGHPVNEKYLHYLKTISSGKDVKFILNIRDEDIVKEYQEAVVAVLPSVYRDIYGKYYPKPELFGLVLAEAMACGTPVICTKVGGMPEVIDDGINGFIVPPNNPYALREKIQYFIENFDAVEKMGRAARQKVLTNFTWDKVMERCLEAYK